MESLFTLNNRLKLKFFCILSIVLIISACNSTKSKPSNEINRNKGRWYKGSMHGKKLSNNWRFFYFKDSHYLVYDKIKLSDNNDSMVYILSSYGHTRLMNNNGTQKLLLIDSMQYFSLEFSIKCKFEENDKDSLTIIFNKPRLEDRFLNFSFNGINDTIGTFFYRTGVKWPYTRKFERSTLKSVSVIYSRGDGKTNYSNTLKIQNDSINHYEIDLNSGYRGYWIVPYYENYTYDTAIFNQDTLTILDMNIEFGKFQCKEIAEKKVRKYHPEIFHKDK